MTTQNLPSKLMNLYQCNDKFMFITSDFTYSTRGYRPLHKIKTEAIDKGLYHASADLLKIVFGHKSPILENIDIATFNYLDYPELLI